MFTATIDAKEVDLVNKVAAVIAPLAFDRTSKWIHKTDAEKHAFEGVQERNRERAREIAMDVIRIVRESN